MTFSAITVIATLMSIVLGSLALIAYLIKVVSLLKEMQKTTSINHITASNQRDTLNTKLIHSEELHSIRFNALETELFQLKEDAKSLKAKLDVWDSRIERLHDK